MNSKIATDFDREILCSTAIAVQERTIGETRHLLHVLWQRDIGASQTYAIASIAFPVVDFRDDIRVIEDVAGTEEEARRLFVAVADGGVFPYNLEEVLYDLLVGAQ